MDRDWIEWNKANRRLARRKVKAYFRENLGKMLTDTLRDGKCVMECKHGERCPVIQTCANKMREVKKYEGDQLVLYMKKVDFARGKAIQDSLGERA